MASDRLPRKLAAIFYADVAGYSRLTGEDEDATHRRLSEYLDLVAETVQSFNGKVMHYAGDAVLAQFNAVIDALSSATAVQSELRVRNSNLPDSEKVQFRIGINLGDVIEDRGDIYGDGVNVAARLESLAEPGGICVSDTVRIAAGNKLPVRFESLGQQMVKNIAEPVLAYEVRFGDEAEESSMEGSPTVGKSDKPSIAVLPLVNMSGDPEQEFFADGLSEDITTELSRFHNLMVISRNSAFVFKGKATRVPEVAKDLGVEYVLEGSVRKAGDRIRVTVQLIDAETDRHVWAERYNRELKDIFEVQDEVTAAIVSTLAGRIEAATQERVKRKTPDNMAAYEYVLAGKTLHHRSTREDNARALEMLDNAIALDPDYAHAHAWRACVLGQSWAYGWCDDMDATWTAVLSELQVALSLDDNDSDVHRILAAVHIASSNFERAAYHQERGLSLNPNNDLIVVQQGELLTWTGRPEEGMEWIKDAMRLNPHHPERFWNHLGRAYFVARRYADAIDAFKRIGTPDHTHHAFLAAAHALSGDSESSAFHAKEVLRLDPDFSVTTYLDTLHYQQETDLEHHRQGLLKSGLPRT